MVRSGKSKKKRAEKRSEKRKAAEATSSLFGPLPIKPPKTKTKQKKQAPTKAVGPNHRFKHKRNARVPHHYKVDHHHGPTRHGSTRIPVKSIKNKTFHLLLPKEQLLYCRDMPWYYNNFKKHSNTKPKLQKSILLPHDLFDESALQQLDRELDMFQKYVRLSSNELDAREFLIAQVSNLAQVLFEKRNSTSVSIQAFGSHATPEVCCFTSDVDLCMWGVVPASTHMSFVEPPAYKHADAKKSDESNKKKQERLQKWRQALAEADPAAITEADPVDKQNGKASKGSSPTGTENSNDATWDSGEHPLFIIDRVGVPDEDETQVTSHVNICPEALAGSAAAPLAVANDSAFELPTNNGANQENKSTKESNEFLFVIDRHGAKEFGSEENDTKNDIIKATEGSRTANASSNTAIGSTQDSLVPGTASAHEEEQVDKKPGTSKDAPIDVDASHSPESSPAGQESIIVGESSVADNENSTAPGSSKDEPLVVAEGNDSAAVDLCSDSDDSDSDSADKLQSYHRSRSFSDVHNATDEEDDAHWQALVEKKRRTVSLSSSTTTNSDVEDGDFQYNDMQVSFVSRQGLPRQEKPIGPTGQTRKLVVGALQSLGRKIRQSPYTQTVEVRKFARVPIINMATHLGFESDVAIGGHNGTDTSKYASSQTERYNSFATVVLFLKILLAQQDLDKPFTGGLGSYKLYVLVAHHVERHVALGGSDRPSEILLAFFFRYSGIRDVLDIDSGAATVLSQNVVLRSNGGSADLQPVFNIDHCTKLFNVCWERLLNWSVDNVDGSSFLGNIIDAKTLRRDRDDCLRKAALWRKQHNSMGVARDHPGKVSAGRKVSHVFGRKNHGRKEMVNKRQRRGNETNSDDEASRLMAGYGLQRGAHGGLIPRHRPDVKARKAAKQANPFSEVLGRARKNRKNKKKQKRDEGLSQFANNAS